MYVLTYVVPALVIGFFLWKGRRDPVYILALPLLLGYGRSIFLDTYSLRLGLVNGVTVYYEDVTLMVLLVVLVYVRAIRRTASPARFTLQLYLCVGLLVLLTAKAVAASFTSGTGLASPSSLLSLVKAVAWARVWFYLPLSVMLWHVVLKRFSRQEILRLLGILTWVTAACAVVYLADLAGIKTYTSIWDPFSTIQTPGGLTVSRDYLFLPAFLTVALGYSLAHLVYGRQRATYLLVAVVLTACAVFSFTRTFALVAAGLWVVAIFWWAVIIRLRGRSGRVRTSIGPARAFLLVGAFAAVSSAGVFGWSTIAAWWAFLALRLGGLQRGAAGDPNSALRLNLYLLAARTVSHEGFFLGTLMTTIGAGGAAYFRDSYWAYVLLSVGWLGLLVVGALVFSALTEATVRALRADARSAMLGLTILFALLSMILYSSAGGAWADAATIGAFFLAAPDVRFRVVPSASSAAVPTGIEEP